MCAWRSTLFSVVTWAVCSGDVVAMFGWSDASPEITAHVRAIVHELGVENSSVVSVRCAGRLCDSSEDPAGLAIAWLSDNRLNIVVEHHWKYLAEAEKRFVLARAVFFAQAASSKQWLVESCVLPLLCTAVLGPLVATSCRPSWLYGLPVREVFLRAYILGVPPALFLSFMLRGYIRRGRALDLDAEAALFCGDISAVIKRFDNEIVPPLRISEVEGIGMQILFCLFSAAEWVANRFSSMPSARARERHLRALVRVQDRVR